MLIDYVLFTITFIVSAALAVVGIMISYQLYQIHEKPVLQVLLYQQIFVISFYVYGIWGNVALQQILADLSLPAGLNSKLTIFIPVLGIPFLAVSWFMLMRFSFELNGIKVTKIFPIIYFPVLFIFILLFSVLIDKEIVNIVESPDRFIIRSIASLNFIIHIIFLVPFFNKQKNKPLTKEIRFTQKHVLLYMCGVFLYSVILFFYNFWGTFSICISIVLLFAVSISVPVIIKLNEKTILLPQNQNNMSFDDFCNLYEISKRESEIIMELCTGKSNKEISEKLFISLQTVKDHNYHIYSKLGVKTRGQLTNLVREKTGL
jgi:DNA-binding CsgD family transcriptional regulator